MQFSKLLSTDAEERAVSPVIGVILMVAITVILAAVIASFVLGLGQNQSVQPTANFDFNYDDSSTPTVTVTHTSGDTVPENELFLRGSEIDTGEGNWVSDASGDATGSVEGESAIRSGDEATVDLTSDHREYVLRVVWESTSGESSAELAESRGPDA